MSFSYFILDEPLHFSSPGMFRQSEVMTALLNGHIPNLFNRQQHLDSHSLPLIERSHSNIDISKSI